MKVYTQAELEGMSDLELNSFVQGINGPNITNPCNNWGDCGALIDECGVAIYPAGDSDPEIGTTWLTGEWVANAINYGEDNEASMTSDLIQCKADNLKRAAVIVYILIKQGNQNEINS